MPVVVAVERHQRETDGMAREQRETARMVEALRIHFPADRPPRRADLAARRRQDQREVGMRAGLPAALADRGGDKTDLPMTALLWIHIPARVTMPKLD